MVGYDRFRSPKKGYDRSTGAVTANFRREMAATGAQLEAARGRRQAERQVKRRETAAERKHEKEHKVAAWNVKRSGNPWLQQDCRVRLFSDEVRLDAVGGRYREPIRTVHKNVTDAVQLINPDFKSSLPTPPGSAHWSQREYGRNDVFGAAASLRRPCTERGTSRFVEEQHALSPGFLAKKQMALRALQKRAASVESGSRGRARADFIAKTRFFVAPDAIGISDGGYITQAFPQAHPPTAPWRQELEKGALGSWSHPNVNPRELSSTGQSITSASAYYNAREALAAWQPQRALTDRARVAVRTAESGGRPATTMERTFRHSTQSLTLSLPERAVPPPFMLSDRGAASRRDTSSMPTRFLRDETVDPLRDEAALRYVGARQASVVGRLPLDQLKRGSAVKP